MRGHEGIEENVKRRKRDHVIGREIGRVSGVGMRTKVERERVAGVQRPKVEENLMEAAG